MRFLGRNIPATGNIPTRLQAEVVSDMKTRPEGVRIKHRLGENSIKMYDKQGSVLRVETTINDAADFKSFRTPEGKPEGLTGAITSVLGNGGASGTGGRTSRMRIIGGRCFDADAGLRTPSDSEAECAHSRIR